MSNPSQNYVFVEKSDSKSSVGCNQSVADRIGDRDLSDLVLRRLGLVPGSDAPPRVQSVGGPDRSVEHQSGQVRVDRPGNPAASSPLQQMSDISSAPAVGPAVSAVKSAADSKGSAPTSLQAAALMHQVMQRSMRSKYSSGKGSKSNKQWNYRPFCCDLVQRVTTTGSSATFFNNVTTLEPNSSGVTEAATLATVFDEARCPSFTIYVRFGAQAGVIQGAWAVAYDVANAGPYASTQGVLITGQRIGPISFGFGFGTVAENKTGYHIHTFKCLNPLQATGFNSELVGSGWFATGDTTAQIGYLKYAADALTGIAVQSDTFIVYHMEYRERT